MWSSLDTMNEPWKRDNRNDTDVRFQHARNEKKGKVTFFVWNVTIVNA